MRGEVERQRVTLSVVSADHRIPADHPLRRIKALADAELARLSPVFDRVYAGRGRPSVPPERLLKACLLIALYSIRSEHRLCEQLHYNLLFQWFLDLDLHTIQFDASTFAKNKERLLRANVARLFFEGVVQQAKAAHLLSAEHFTVDGTLIEAWASLKSFRPKGERPGDRPPPDDPGNPTVKEAKLAFAGHVLMENRHGFCVDILSHPGDGNSRTVMSHALSGGHASDQANVVCGVAEADSAADISNAKAPADGRSQ